MGNLILINISNKFRGHEDFLFGGRSIPSLPTELLELTSKIDIHNACLILSSPQPPDLAISVVLSLKTNIPIQVLPQLMEIDFGRWEGCHPSDLKGFQSYSVWQSRPLAAVFPGGESFQDVVRRIDRFLVWLSRSKLKNVAVVSSEEILRLIYIKNAALKEEDFHSIHLPKDCVKEEFNDSSTQSYHIEIEGERIFFRTYLQEDIPLFQEWYKDIEVRPYMSWGNERWHAKAIKEYIQRLIFSDPPHDFIRVVALKDNMRAIGSVGLHGIDMQGGCAELGIVIGDKNYRGKGLGTEAVKLLVKYAFEKMGLRRVWLPVYEYNKRAIKSYIKAGFIQEGKMRKSHYYNNKWHDVVLMSLLM